MTHKTPSIVVLCTGNSCRSQMMAGWLRHLAGDRLVVHSAGVRPSKALHARGVEMMAEVGIDTPAMGESPKHWSVWAAGEGTPRHDFAAFLCPNAEAACPEWNSFAESKLSWHTEDPGDFVGDEAAKLANFRDVRDELKLRAIDWLAQQGITS